MGAPPWRFGSRVSEYTGVVAGFTRINLRDKVEGEVVELRPWDAVRVSPETARGLEAGPGGAEILAFGAPNTEGRDVEILQGWWE